MREYRQALNERDSFDIGSVGWRAAQLKLEQVVEKYLKAWRQTHGDGNSGRSI